MTQSQCKHRSMKTGAARCVYVCACMHYATGALSQAALPGARGESVAKTSNLPPPLLTPHPMHTSLSQTPKKRQSRQQTEEIRS